MLKHTQTHNHPQMIDQESTERWIKAKFDEYEVVTEAKKRKASESTVEISRALYNELMQARVDRDKLIRKEKQYLADEEMAMMSVDGCTVVISSSLYSDLIQARVDRDKVIREKKQRLAKETFAAHELQCSMAKMTDSISKCSLQSP
jgi:hypothetical protein